MQSCAVVFGGLGVDDLISLEKLITTAGAIAVLFVLIWRLPLLLKLMLDFGLAVQRENAETVRQCCRHQRTVLTVESFGVPGPELFGDQGPAAELRQR